MSLKEDLQLSMNDEGGKYNFVIRGETVLSISVDDINSDTANIIFDGLISLMGVTLSSVSELTDGKLSFSNVD